ncbi:hypothetical protein CIPAW_10G126900 [Carya illinoinensis]|uniref:Uncharacterized protein n=1 Tax=Carya illinoinensis TaxID=32201 RepID=A0A8T1PDK6_CARIL|nr:hypothetical protein CIPAW_10G126900 [Carya illinoinensis]
MVIRSKMKWVILSLLILSLLSLLAQLSVTRLSTAGLVQYSAEAGMRTDFANVSRSQFSRNKKIWGVEKTLESLQPYANPRSRYMVGSWSWGYSCYSNYPISWVQTILWGHTSW